MAATRDDFEQWLFDMDECIEEFLAFLPSDVQKRLDYSPSSLSTLESWLLTKYARVKEIMLDSERSTLDHASRYVGETFRKNIGGIWTIDQDNRDNAFYRIPVLQKKDLWTECPVTLVTASLDRRTGRYIEKVLQNFIKNSSANT